MKHNSQSAFTLVEILTGIVVFAAISACSWVAVSTLFRSEQLTRNRTVAINLLQKSQEEIRQASLTFYDSLENCQFPGPASNAGNAACGLQALNPNFNGYTRSVTITQENNSTELKRAVITVMWTDQGNNLSMNSAVLLARPPDPLPGNILGTVRSSATGNALIGGVTLTVTLVGNTTTRTTTSTGALGAKNENFNFYDSSTGAFMLPVGSWSLSATANGYYNYTSPNPITVTSNAETRLDFMMDPKPTNATIRVKMIDAMTGNQVSGFYNYSRFYILDDYAQTSQIIAEADDTTAGNYSIAFNNNNPRSFTINTYYTYQSNYAGKPNCYGYNYGYDGWSSANVQADNTTLTCGNPYNGSNTSDRITVNPGDDISVQVPLYPIPTATVIGKVVDKNGTPLSGAVLYAAWPSAHGVQSWWSKNGAYQTVVTDTNGKYSYLVPAAQEMFPNNASGALTLRAQYNMPYTGCCNSAQQALIYGYVSVTNLFANSTIAAPDIVIGNASNSTCGNVKGNITDGSSGASLNGVSISVQGVGNATDGSGNYLYQCQTTGYKLPAGLAVFYSSLNSYYNYASNGNSWYAAFPSVNIPSNSSVNYDSKLWPIGTGSIIVNVVDAGTNLPISGANVQLNTYNGGQSNLTTGNTGSAQFNNVLETWPAVGLPADPFYNHNPQQHSLNVTHPSGIYNAYTQAIPILQKNDTLTITVKLVPSGGT